MIKIGYFISHGRRYHLDTFGAIHQLNARPYTYDEGYVATYDTDEYKAANKRLQEIRLAFVEDAHGYTPDSILDVGYGNGAFLIAADERGIKKLYGKDVTGLQLPIAEIVDDYIQADVITFWDCLEHIPDLAFLASLDCQTLCISLPWCHYKSKGQEWFDKEYKHRKPDEHLHHFSCESLTLMMQSYGWKAIRWNHDEDEVRTSPGKWYNILTMAFHKIHPYKGVSPLNEVAARQEDNG